MGRRVGGRGECGLWPVPRMPQGRDETLPLAHGSWHSWTQWCLCRVSASTGSQLAPSSRFLFPTMPRLSPNRWRQLWTLSNGWRHCLATRYWVVGPGRLGQLVCRVLHASGARVFAVGRNAQSMARLGGTVEHTLFADQVEPRSFAMAVECTGNSSGLSIALAALRPRGLLVLKSTYGRALELEMGRIVVDELRLVGSRCGALDSALRWLHEGRVDVEALVDGRYPLSAGIEAFALSRQPGVLKVCSISASIDYQSQITGPGSPPSRARSCLGAARDGPLMPECTSVNPASGSEPQGDGDDGPRTNVRCPNAHGNPGQHFEYSWSCFGRKSRRENQGPLSGRPLEITSALISVRLYGFQVISWSHR